MDSSPKPRGKIAAIKASRPNQAVQQLEPVRSNQAPAHPATWCFHCSLPGHLTKGCQRFTLTGRSPQAIGNHLWGQANPGYDKDKSGRTKNMNRIPRTASQLLDHIEQLENKLLQYFNYHAPRRDTVVSRLLGIIAFNQSYGVEQGQEKNKQLFPAETDFEWYAMYATQHSASLVTELRNQIDTAFREGIFNNFELLYLTLNQQL